MQTLDDVFAAMDEDPTIPAVATGGEFRADGCFATAQEARAFLMAGNATATFVSKKTEARFTFKVRKPEDGTGSVLFVSVLNGPDNWSNYAYLGFIRSGVFFHGGHKAKVKADAPSAQAFAWGWQQLARDLMPATLQVWHEGKCGRCGRKLTVPSSIASGFGPECQGKLA